MHATRIGDVVSSVLSLGIDPCSSRPILSCCLLSTYPFAIPSHPNCGTSSNPTETIIPKRLRSPCLVCAQQLLSYHCKSKGGLQFPPHPKEDEHRLLKKNTAVSEVGARRKVYERMWLMNSEIMAAFAPPLVQKRAPCFLRRRCLASPDNYGSYDRCWCSHSCGSICSATCLDPKAESAVQRHPPTIIIEYLIRMWFSHIQQGFRSCLTRVLYIL